MDYVVIAFKSRSHTVRFSEVLRNNRIQNEIVNTPKQAGVGCGLSVKISKSSLEPAKRVLRAFKSNTFAGIFLVMNRGGGRFVKSI